MLSGSNIYKAYGELRVLYGLDIEVKKAEILSIVGKSGSGKSTLLHILGSLDIPDSGSIHLDGTDFTKLNPNELAEFRNKHIGFIFQFHHLLPEFTALENVCIPGYIRKEDEQKVKANAKELLSFLGLSGRLTHKPNQLSGGEQQRVAVARALINKPKIIFADEPSGNLDEGTSEELHNLLFKLKDEMQQTFVIVTHNNDLAAMSDRCLTLQDGKLVATVLIWNKVASGWK